MILLHYNTLGQGSEIISHINPKTQNISFSTQKLSSPLLLLSKFFSLFPLNTTNSNNNEGSENFANFLNRDLSAYSELIKSTSQLVLDSQQIDSISTILNGNNHNDKKNEKEEKNETVSVSGAQEGAKDGYNNALGLVLLQLLNDDKSNANDEKTGSVGSESGSRSLERVQRLFPQASALKQDLKVYKNYRMYYYYYYHLIRVIIVFNLLFTHIYTYTLSLYESMSCVIYVYIY